MTATFVAFVGVALAAMAFTGGPAGATQAHRAAHSAQTAAAVPTGGGVPVSPTGKKYTMVLVNSLLTNAYRPLMEKYAEIFAKTGPLSKRTASLKVVNTDNTPQAANAALATIIPQKPDIILMDAQSPTAENAEISAACKAGITVVVFNVLTTSSCAWQLGQDLASAGTSMAGFLVAAMHGKGTVFMDRGLLGTNVETGTVNDAKKVFAKYPNVKVYYYTSNSTPSLETSGVAALLAAHPNVNGILALGWGSYADDVVAKAEGASKVPATAGWADNSTLLDCIKYKNPCADIGAPAWYSGAAMALAINVRDHKIKGKPREFLWPVTWNSNRPALKYTNPLGKPGPIQGVALPGLSGDLSLPLSPAWQTFTPKELGF